MALVLTEREKGKIEGAAYALQRIMYILTGDNTCGKSYDPAEVDDKKIHSYAFNLKDGGRHHPISDYESCDEIIGLMIYETHEWIQHME